MLEKLALPTIKEELLRLHASHAHMLPEEAETEYLKVFTPIFFFFLNQLRYIALEIILNAMQKCSTLFFRLPSSCPSTG